MTVGNWGTGIVPVNPAVIIPAEPESAPGVPSEPSEASPEAPGARLVAPEGSPGPPECE